MPRLSRLVVPGVPHHITQRGNRRQRTFFNAADYGAYLTSLRKWAIEFAVQIWCYCLMPNHVHLIAVPEYEDGLALLMAEVSRRHAFRVNERNGWTGHLWQARFFSCPMDDSHLIAAARYVLRNPVPRLVPQPQDWPYSSARAFLGGVSDGLTADTLQRMVDWRALLAADADPATRAELVRHFRSGRPLGSAEFVERLENETGRSLRELPRGRPRKKIVA